VNGGGADIGARAYPDPNAAIMLPGVAGSPDNDEDDDGKHRGEATTAASGRPAPADGVSPAADTEAAPVARSPSQHRLHDDVKAALFSSRPRAPDRAEDEDYEAGTVLGRRYRVVGLLGRGGMGEVYRARDLVLGEDVAIKFIPRRYADDAALMARFVREVRLARQISHPNVCRVHDIGDVDGRALLSMEYIDGEDLGSLLRRIGRLPLEKATELAQQLCTGLAALHAEGVLHRDLKPENVMIDGRGRLKITDFGLAAIGEELPVHERGDGTPAYMAPEQARGGEVTVQTDLYALGLILYEVLTGTHARTGLARGSTGAPRAPVDARERVSTLVVGIPPEVDDVIAACLAENPDDRPRSALAVAASLPGGDPVAAALAAGRTPSVDALVAAGPRHGLPQWLALAMATAMASVLVFLGASFWAGTALGRASTTLSPEVLEHEAERLLDGVVPRPVHPATHFELEYDRAWLRPAEGEPPQVEDEGRSPILFHLRRQPRTFFPELVVTMDDPPDTVPGAARATLDGAGRLRSMRVVHPELGPAIGQPLDEDALLEAAGLDRAYLAPTPAMFRPHAHADERHAWIGWSEALDAGVRVEIATLENRLVQLEVLPEWDPRFDAEPDDTVDPRTKNVSAYVIVPFVVLVLLALAREARRVAERGETDPAGARRVATIVGVLGIFDTVVDPELVAGNYNTVPWRLIVVLGGSVLTYWLYLMLEPLCRRYLSGAMTSWVRLVRGHVRDPLVARDVLVGTFLALVAAAADRLDALLREVPDLAPTDLHVLRTSLPALENAEGAMSGTPLVFLLLVLVVRLVRSRPVASAIFVAGLVGVFVLFAIQQDATGTGLLLHGLVGLCWGVAIVRFGLLAAVAFQLVRNVIASYPFTLDLERWYAWSGLVGVLVVLALIAWGVAYGVRKSSAAAVPTLR
jgi:tRNA A-37 threonylcarbamoyl transferase component Bud32